MKQKAFNNLVHAFMCEKGKDFTLDRIYRIACKPPHQDELTTAELHSRVSRYIGEARAQLKKQGYVLVQGELRHSYRVVKRTRSTV